MPFLLIWFAQWKCKIEFCYQVLTIRKQMDGMVSNLLKEHKAFGLVQLPLQAFH